ncbi:hypothetical protein BLNAU_22871 [Blattamonas nauphoetae]|uniref:Uncharacterized protein n=1 Tax=Blattamonas nauphoetae TaxID=2049346 RepID=A0ABQ9WUW5_9EUKA|nr:hypothetical protein BLNAU_22871 [Blattamonas nauphoetae]
MGGWTRNLAGRTKQRKLLAVRVSNKMGAIVGRKEEQPPMNLFNPNENKETSLSWLFEDSPAHLIHIFPKKDPERIWQELERHFNPQFHTDSQAATH